MKEVKIETNKSYRISPVPATKKLIAFLCDLLSVIAGYVALFFAILYGVCGTAFNYNTNCDYITDIETKYSLNIGSGKDYQEYESVIKEFFFSYFDEEIVDFYKEYYNEDFSLIRIYNIQILSLPLDVSSTNYSNGFFEYVQNSQGYYDYNIEGRIVANNGGDYFKRSLADHYYSKINYLRSLLSYFDSQYNTSVSEKLLTESLVRCVSFGLSVLVFFLIIPLCNKNRQTLFEIKFKVLCANKNDGFLVKPYKTCLRPLTYFLVPFIFITIASNPGFYIFAVFYIFISMLLSLVTQEHRDISDFMLKTITIDLADSLVFRNVEEAEKYYNSDEYVEVEDEEFLNKLSSIESINIPSYIDNENDQSKGEEK